MSDSPWYARQLIARGLRKLGVKPGSKTAVPFAGGIDKAITLHCPLCDVHAILPAPVRRVEEATLDYLLRCKDEAIRAHAIRRPTCPGEGLQMAMSI